MSYCSGKSKAIVQIPSIKETIISTNTPVEVTVQSGNSSSLKCWKVIGRDYQNNRVVFYGCAASAELRSGANYGEVSVQSSSPPDAYGLVPVFDNVPWNGRYSAAGRYQVGAIIQQVTVMDEPGILGGTCDGCLSLSGYTLTVTDTTGKIYEKQFSSLPKFTVACDDGCPSGYIRCETVSYPGYCCLSCQEVVQKLKSLTEKFKYL